MSSCGSALHRALLIGVVMLMAGCGTTLKTKSNMPVDVQDNTGGLIYNATLIKEGASDPEEHFDFRGVNTGGGREALVKEIAEITVNARRRYQDGSFTFLKHEVITTYAEYLLVVSRNLMREEARGTAVASRASNAFSFTVQLQDRGASDRANAVLRSAASQLSSRVRGSQDPILEILKATVELLRELERFPI